MITEIKSVDISRALETEGWMQEAELLWLANRASEHKLIVELGSYLGRSTRALADNTPGQVIAIDNWYGCKDVNMPEQERKALFLRFNANLGNLLLRRKVLPYRIDHTKVLENQDLSSLQPDMVFIDGDHTKSGVENDIEIWYPKLVSGGLICGHDYYEDADVAVAVNAAFSQVKVHSTIWWAVKP